MNIKEKIKSLLWEKQEHKLPEPEELDGAEERLDPLSKVNITYIFCTLRELKSAKYTHLIAHELSVPEEVVDNDLNYYLDGINGDTVCCLEYPYIEEYYRDTYYTYYARKHHDYNRHCFRLSFFANDVTEENFFSIDIKDKYWGYVVLRPTPRRIVGYSFINPQLFPNKDISICICKRLISVLGRSLETVGFPFLSHDGESVSCSENSILMVFDYYSRRYNNYSRVLPSHLFDLRTNYPCKYQPSIGLSVEEVVSIFNNLGMTTRTYHRKEDNPSMDDLEFASDEFEKLIEIFVESGIPIYVSTTGHAYLLIGRENKLFPQEAKFVAMDGCEQAYFSDEDIHDIQSIVVPMPDNILLDAHLISPQKFIDKFNQEHPEVTILEDDIEYYHRIFLTTSRSFKKHIVESGLSHADKMLIVCTTMPKFVWVCESIEKTELNKDIKDIRVDAIGIYDATDYPTESNHWLLAKTKNLLIVPTTDNSKLRRKKFSIFKCNQRIPTFQLNLKGTHTKWQG